MQCLQWQKKRASNDATNKKWLLKTPHHLHFLDCLLSTFPDAQIIQTHRDPIDTIPSISSFNYNLWITQADQVDATLVGKQWGDMFARGLKHAMQIRELHKHQFIDIGFKNLLQDPLNTSNAIFKFIGMPTTDESLAAMQQHRDQNQRDARPAHDYTLEEFGFSEDEIKADFADYRSQFSDYL